MAYTQEYWVHKVYIYIHMKWFTIFIKEHTRSPSIIQFEARNFIKRSYTIQDNILRIHDKTYEYIMVY